MAVLRRHLHDAVPLSEAATDAGTSIRTARRWLTRYRADGPAGLARPTRPKAGKRTFPRELVELIEGMALLKSPPSIMTIHRRLAGIVDKRKWRMPSYGSVCDIVRRTDPAMLTLVHEGAAAFRDKFGLVHRHRAERPVERHRSHPRPLLSTTVRQSFRSLRLQCRLAAKSPKPYEQYLELTASQWLYCDESQRHLLKVRPVPILSPVG